MIAFYFVGLLDNPSYVKYFLEYKTSDKTDFIKFLNRIILTKDATYSKLNQGVAARILCAILSDFDNVEKNKEAALPMIKHLINEAMKGANKIISDYIILVCFSHLLLVPNMISSFLQRDGLGALRYILEQNSKDLQITFYVFICYWILSFDEAFKKYATDPKVSLSESDYRTNNICT